MICFSHVALRCVSDASYGLLCFDAPVLQEASCHGRVRMSPMGCVIVLGCISMGGGSLDTQPTLSSLNEQILSVRWYEEKSSTLKESGEGLLLGSAVKEAVFVA